MSHGLSPRDVCGFRGFGNVRDRRVHRFGHLRLQLPVVLARLLLDLLPLEASRVERIFPLLFERGQGARLFLPIPFVQRDIEISVHFHGVGFPPHVPVLELPLLPHMTTHQIPLLTLFPATA